MRENEILVELFPDPLMQRCPVALLLSDQTGWIIRREADRVRYKAGRTKLRTQWCQSRDRPSEPQ